MILVTPAEVVTMAFTPRELITPESIRSIKIDIAQEHFIRPRLGNLFYEEMLEAQHTEFCENYIKPALAHFVRYGIIPELAVKVGDQGALIYSSTKAKADQLTTKEQSNTANRTQTTENSQNARTEAMTVDALTYTDDDNIFTEVSNGEPVPGIAEEKRQSNQTITKESKNQQDETQVKTLTDSNLTTTQDAATDEFTQNNTDNSTGEQLRAASPTELRSLSIRALSDANILLAKAVRHIERNLDLYPSYIPSQYSSQIFF